VYRKPTRNAGPAWLVYAVVLVATAAAADPQPAYGPEPVGAALEAKRPSPNVLRVAPDGTDAGAKMPHRLTLAEALRQAEADPADDRIVFEADPSAAGAPVITVNAPLPYGEPGGEAHGCDVIDGGSRGVVIRTVGDCATLLAANAGHLVIRNATLIGDGDAVVSVAGEGIVELQTVVVTGKADAGLAARDRSRVVLTASRVTACGSRGLAATGSSRVTATRCRFSGATFANVDADEGAKATLDTCRLGPGRRFGILATDSANLTVRRTAIVDHDTRGLELQNEAGLHMADAFVERSGNFGAVLFGRSKATLQRVTFRENRGHGFAVRDRTAADLWDCAFIRNEFGGIGAPDAGQGVRVSARRCTFTGQGMRPICRGPMHADPPPPAIQHVWPDGAVIRVAPGTVVDLYADPRGEAGRHLGSALPDPDGTLFVPYAMVRPGEVITATCTTAAGQTSEFNVIAARPRRAVVAALLARTGRLSDDGQAIKEQAVVHRWRPGTHLVFHFAAPTPPYVRIYVTEFVRQLRGWIDDAITVEACFSPDVPLPGAVVVPIGLADAEADLLDGAGGTTFTQWDGFGYFTGDVRIWLARPQRGAPACPRVAVHEMCHALGLYHARVGLLTRMQGIPAPDEGYLNDFAPAPTVFDVAALQALYDPRVGSLATLERMTALGLVPKDAGPEPDVVLVQEQEDASHREPRRPTTADVFSPPATRP
jgi:hypothetical protein